MEKKQRRNNTASVVDKVLYYLRYWKWFLLFLAVCLTVGTIVLLMSPKQYRSSISVLLNEDKGTNNQNNPTEINLEALGLFSTTNNIENEIAILSSPDLMRQVADTLNLQVSYYLRNKLRKSEIYTESPLYIKYIPAVKTNLDEIELEIEKSTTGYEIEGVYTDREGYTTNIKETMQSLPAHITIPADSSKLNIKLTGKEFIENEKYYVTINNITKAVNLLCSDLSVAQTSKNSSVLNIRLLTNNTEKGAIILRELVKQYNVMNVKTHNEIAYNTALFINERLKEIASELGDAEKQVVEYKQQNKIADLETEAQLFVQQTGENEQRLTDIETQLNVLSMVERYVNNSANKLKLIPNLDIADVALTQIITEYNQKLLNYDTFIKGTGEENPARIRFSKEIDNMRSNIVGSLRNVRNAYEVSKRDIQKKSYATNSRIMSMPQQAKGLIEKEREQKIKESLFLFLMQKREETSLSIASTADKARIVVSPQLDILPVSPQPKVILTLALLFGLAIPVLAIYIIDLFKTQIRGREDLEGLSEVNIIGEISRNETKDLVVIGVNRNTAIAEMFRSLRNNLGFVLKNETNKVILITSTIAHEGKTFMSVNLALSFALSGKKVLLIGADVRNPKLRKYINVDNRKGLTDFLISPDSNWKTYLNKTDIDKNIDVMIAGTIPPNPNELLMSSKLKLFLLEAKAEYDYIILDTAPVGLVSDTYLIEGADITLYIVREGVTPRSAVNFINMQYEEGKLKNMYLVLNDSALNNTYQYGYGKKYGYETK